MFYYIFLFTTTTILGFLYDSLNIRCHNKPELEIQKRWILFFILFQYILIIGCKGYNVGSDTLAYILKLEDARGESLYNFLLSRFFLEPLFYSFVWLCSYITKSPSFFFIVSSLLYFSVFLNFIKKYSKSLGWGIWMLNSMGFATMMLSTVRQSLAISFCLLSFMYYEKSKLKSWLFVFVALLTHMSSFIFLPMMFIGYFNKQNIVRNLIIILGVATVFGFTIMRKIAAYYNATTGKYDSEILSGEGVGGYGMIAFLLVFLYMGYNSYFNPKKNLPIQYYNEFLGVGIALAVFIISRVNVATIRLYWYYLSFVTIYVPNVFYNTKKPKRILWQYFIFAISLYYLGWMVMASPYEESRLFLPYKFFWD